VEGEFYFETDYQGGDFFRPPYGRCIVIYVGHRGRWHCKKVGGLKGPGKEGSSESGILCRGTPLRGAEGVGVCENIDCGY